MSSFKGFTRIATGFDATEVSLSITALEGAGFIVIAPGRLMNANVPHFSLAFGGVPILVPSDDAADARAFLHAIQTDGIKIASDEETQADEDDADEPEAVGKRGVWGRIRELLLYLLGGVSSPVKGIFVSTRQKQCDRQ